MELTVDDLAEDFVYDWLDSDIEFTDVVEYVNGQTFDYVGDLDQFYEGVHRRATEMLRLAAGLFADRDED